MSVIFLIHYACICSVWQNIFNRIYSAYLIDSYLGEKQEVKHAPVVRKFAIILWFHFYLFYLCKYANISSGERLRNTLIRLIMNSYLVLRINIVKHMDMFHCSTITVTRRVGIPKLSTIEIQKKTQIYFLENRRKSVKSHNKSN